MFPCRRSLRSRSVVVMAASAVLASACSGCFAPLHSPGIPAALLPDDFRLPCRTGQPALNYAALVGPSPTAYLLGAGDVLEVTLPDLVAPGDARPFAATVLETGEIHLPRLGPVYVGDLTLSQARVQVEEAARAQLNRPGAAVRLVQKGTVNVLVLGAVARPGVHPLPRYENDIAHALAAAGGFSPEAGTFIEVHRRWGAAPSSTGAFPTSAFPSGPAWPAGQGGALDRGAAGPPSPDPLPGGTTPYTPPDAAPFAPFGPAAPYAPGAPVTPVSWETPGPTEPRSPLSSYRTQFGHPGEYGGDELLEPYGGAVGHPVAAAAPMFGAGPGPAGMPAAGWAAGLPGVSWQAAGGDPVLRIPLVGAPETPLAPEDVILNIGDVVIVPNRVDDVFYVVGLLSPNGRTRFSTNDRDREIGGGFILPPNREIDVVTAVAMAGYIDPIESPTTVTVHRTRPDGGPPLLIRVDLIAARSDPRETILVEPGDILYLNPDSWWYARRMWDRIVDRALGTAAGRLISN